MHLKQCHSGLRSLPQSPAPRALTRLRPGQPALQRTSLVPQGQRPALKGWHGGEVKKEQPQVDPQGAPQQWCQFGGALKGNANPAWVQQFVHHLDPHLVPFKLC